MKNTKLTFPTKGGNILAVNYNPENGALFIDLIASNGRGSTELFNRTLDEGKLLQHTISPVTERMALPTVWAEEFGFYIIDLDGWRIPEKDFHTPITAREFVARACQSTIRVTDREKYKEFERFESMFS